MRQVDTRLLIAALRKKSGHKAILPTDFSALQLKLGLTVFFGRHIWSSASSSETFVSVQKVFFPVCSPTQ